MCVGPYGHVYNDRRVCMSCIHLCIYSTIISLVLFCLILIETGAGTKTHFAVHCTMYIHVHCTSTLPFMYMHVPNKLSNDYSSQ